MIHHKRKITSLVGKTHQTLHEVHHSTRRIMNRTVQIVLGALWFFISFILFPSFAFGASFPAQQGYVTDTAGMLSPATRTALEQQLAAYEQQTTNEIAVVTINSLKGDPIEDYSIRLFEQWGIGQAGKDNGVLFLISKEEKQIRIDVGYGLEPVLTDGECGSIIRTVVVPKFKANDYEGGIRDGVAAIIAGIGSTESGVDQVVGNNPLRTTAGDQIDSLFKTFGELIFVIPAFFIYLAGYMARTKSIVLGGVVGGVGGGIVGLLLGTTFSLAVLVIGGVVFGLIVDWLLSRNYQALSSSGGRTDWFHTYGGFGGSRGFGGFKSGGGFGGFGGGRSGGGGASGGW